MTDLDPMRPLGASSQVVGDDMLAIFGPGVRDHSDTPPPPRRTERASGHSRGRGVAIASTLLFTAAAAGLYFGTNVVGAPSPVPASESRSRPPSATRLAPPTAPVEAAPVPASEPAEIAPPLASHEQPARIAVPPVPIAPIRAPEPVAQPQASSNSVTVVRPIDTPGPARIADTAGEPRIASPLDVAEQRAIEAFTAAEQAGVRPRILRDYRREFTLARADVYQRPDRAERVYAMITADLFQLATEAEDRSQ